MLQDFKKFLVKGNAIDMAVGFIFGTAFALVVKSLVANIIMPPVSLLVGDVDFSNMFYALDGKIYDSLALAEEAGAPIIKYGTFINDVVGFILLGFVIFMLVKNINKMKKVEEAKPVVKPADTILLEEIRDALMKKPVAQKAPAKIAAKPATKTVTKTTPVKKAPAKKPVAKKTPAKKPAAKK